MVLGRRSAAPTRRPPDRPAAVAEAEVRPAALARAAALSGKDSHTMHTIKARLYAGTLAALRGPQGLGPIEQQLESSGAQLA